jgi:hypothetical protein
MMTTLEIENKEFLAELQDLLVRYNADITFSVGSGSDTHGLYDTKMVISRRLDPKSFKEVDILEVDGWSINAYELKVNQDD